MNDIEFKNLIEKSVYCIEKEKYGHSVFILKELIPKNFNKARRELLILHIINNVNDSLNISKKYGKLQGYVHLYLDDCGNKNFSRPLFSEINKRLSDTFQDTLVELYIYTNSKFLSLVWPLFKQLLDPITQKKIRIIKK